MTVENKESDETDDDNGDDNDDDVAKDSDDFADVELIGDTPKVEVDSFCAKLAAEWNKDESDTSADELARPVSPPPNNKRFHPRIFMGTLALD